MLEDSADVVLEFVRAERWQLRGLRNGRKAAFHWLKEEGTLLWYQKTPDGSRSLESAQKCASGDEIHTCFQGRREAF